MAEVEGLLKEAGIGSLLGGAAGKVFGAARNAGRGIKKGIIDVGRSFKQGLNSKYGSKRRPTGGLSTGTKNLPVPYKAPSTNVPPAVPTPNAVVQPTIGSAAMDFAKKNPIKTTAGLAGGAGYLANGNNQPTVNRYG